MEMIAQYRLFWSQRSLHTFKVENGDCGRFFSKKDRSRLAGVPVRPRRWGLYLWRLVHWPGFEPGTLNTWAWNNYSMKGTAFPDIIRYQKRTLACSFTFSRSTLVFMSHLERLLSCAWLTWPDGTYKCCFACVRRVRHFWLHFGFSRKLQYHSSTILWAKIDLIPNTKRVY